MGEKNARPRFTSKKFGVRVSVVPNIFTIYPQHFLKPETSETVLCSFTKFFGSMKQTFFDGKLWYSLFCIKFFDTPSFLKHWRDAHEMFGHCDTNNFRRKNVIPLLCIKFFVIISFLENRRGPLQNFSFRSCETKNLDGTVTPPPAQMHGKFCNKKLFETQNCSPMNKFWHNETNNFRRKIVKTPPSHP